MTRPAIRPCRLELNQTTNGITNAINIAIVGAVIVVFVSMADETLTHVCSQLPSSRFVIGLALSKWQVADWWQNWRARGSLKCGCR